MININKYRLIAFVLLLLVLTFLWTVQIFKNFINDTSIESSSHKNFKELLICTLAVSLLALTIVAFGFIVAILCFIINEPNHKDNKLDKIINIYIINSYITYSVNIMFLYIALSLCMFCFCLLLLMYYINTVFMLSLIQFSIPLLAVIIYNLV